MSSNAENIEPEVPFGDLLETVSEEYLEYEPSSTTRIQSLIADDDIDGIGSEISKTITVILKAITHRGTQTLIQCDPGVSKDDFINMMIDMRI